MLAILDHSDGRGRECWPSLNTLGNELGGLAARTVGATAAQLNPLRPWLASLQLALASIQKAGYVAENGGDQVLHARAAATGKPIKGFETAPQQIGFVADMSEDAQLALLRSGLKEFDQADAMLGRMVAAWAITFPAAAVMGCIMFWIANGLGGLIGPAVVSVILIGLSWYMWKRSRINKVDHTNVTDEWHDGSKPEVAVAAHDIIDPHHELDEVQAPSAH